MNSRLSSQFTSHARLGIFFLLLIVLFIAFEPFLPKYNENTVEIPVPPAAPVRVAREEEIIKGNITKKQVIFTFDGGAGAHSGDQILDIFKKYQMKSTFFLTGEFVEKNPDLVKKIIRDGHEIFNHTYSHPYLTQVSDEEIRQQLKKMEGLLRGLGASSRPFFRAPFGDRDDRVRKIAFQEGYQSVYWTVDAHDWEESLGISGTEVENRILANLEPGTIYLMHIGDTITGSILDRVLVKIAERGYKVVSLTEGL